MKKFRITYIPTYDHEDCCNVWVYALDKEDAIREAQKEWHDIYDVISCLEIHG